MKRSFLTKLTQRFSHTDSRRKASPRSQNFLFLESLESRTLLSVVFSDPAQGGNGLLTINGTDKSDVIVVSADIDGQVVVNQAPVDQGQSIATPFVGVTAVIINGDNGNDKIAVLGQIRKADHTAIGVQINGNDGNDKIIGSEGNDTIDGGAGNDKIDGGDGNDSLFGGVASLGVASLEGHGHGHGHGGQRTGGNDRIDGGNGDDLISGGDGNDKLNGGAGNDAMSGGDGNDLMDGGDGNDLIYGGDSNDNIKGGSGADSIFGGDGKDNIKAGDGDDFVDGGLQKDNINGGAGTDTNVTDAQDNVKNTEVAATPDVVAPTVTSTDPANAALLVPVNKVITATFSEQMNPFTITTASFTVVTTSGATPVTGVVSYDATTRTAAFTPTGNLAATTQFTATITTGATDLAGNPLVAFVWSFTTA